MPITPKRGSFLHAESQLLIRRFGSLPISRGMVMIDGLAMALATVAMGIPAIITAAALGSKLGLHW